MQGLSLAHAPKYSIRRTTAGSSISSARTKYFVLTHKSPLSPHVDVILHAGNSDTSYPVT
jgi:hypothetical protein